MGAEILVVNPGFADLDAAREFQRSGKHVRIIETRDHVGGLYAANRSGLPRSHPLGGHQDRPRVVRPLRRHPRVG